MSGASSSGEDPDVVASSIGIGAVGVMRKRVVDGGRGSSARDGWCGERGGSVVARFAATSVPLLSPSRTAPVSCCCQSCRYHFRDVNAVHFKRSVKNLEVPRPDDGIAILGNSSEEFY